jgi:hypothetical protein
MKCDEVAMGRFNVLPQKLPKEYCENPWSLYSVLRPRFKPDAFQIQIIHSDDLFIFYICALLFE